MDLSHRTVCTARKRYKKTKAHLWAEMDWSLTDDEIAGLMGVASTWVARRRSTR